MKTHLFQYSNIESISGENLKRDLEAKAMETLRENDFDLAKHIADFVEEISNDSTYMVKTIIRVFDNDDSKILADYDEIGC